MTEPPGREPEARLPARRPPSEPAPAPVTADRFSAPASAHVNELTPERAAKIVQQSASARTVGLLATIVVVLFVIGYYFYELGAPLGLTVPRLTQQDELQQVTAVERGYTLYQANCARCHGPNGKGLNEGWTAPPLNDQPKLFGGVGAHLSESYIRTVLTVGGRYVCGNPKSGMPVWSNQSGGPLNYRQIQELIAFLRAPSDHEYVIRDEETVEPILGPDGRPRTFKGWRDVDYEPAEGATPVPDCWSASTASQGPSETLPPDSVTLELLAEVIKFDKTALEAPAGKPFGIHLANRDAGTPHDVDIRRADGSVVSDQATITGPAEVTYVYPTLAAGTYTFICSIHPIPAMTGTLTVK